MVPFCWIAHNIWYCLTLRSRLLLKCCVTCCYVANPSCYSMCLFFLFITKQTFQKTGGNIAEVYECVFVFVCVWQRKKKSQKWNRCRHITFFGFPKKFFCVAVELPLTEIPWWWFFTINFSFDAEDDDWLSSSTMSSGDGMNFFCASYLIFGVGWLSLRCNGIGLVLLLLLAFIANNDSFALVAVPFSLPFNLEIYLLW